YRKRGLGDRLRDAAEKRARKAGARQVFVLTTQTEHWFEERGYVEVPLAQLPASRQAWYNYQRRSKVLLKSVD
ncbi:MAG: amino-acid N-acetyltransferase, partial [Thiobacillaceae bacterium]